MMAAALGFATAEQGGVLSEDTLLQAHATEMILPPRLSTFVQKAAANASEGMSGSEESRGGDMYLHYAPHIEAIDHNGMADILQKHSAAITKMVHTEMRRQNHV